jgi:hypothetical protein
VLNDAWHAYKRNVCECITTCYSSFNIISPFRFHECRCSDPQIGDDDEKRRQRDMDDRMMREQMERLRKETEEEERKRRLLEEEERQLKAEVERVKVEQLNNERMRHDEERKLRNELLTLRLEAQQREIDDEKKRLRLEEEAHETVRLLEQVRIDGEMKRAILAAEKEAIKAEIERLKREEDEHRRIKLEEQKAMVKEVELLRNQAIDADLKRQQLSSAEELLRHEIARMKTDEEASRRALADSDNNLRLQLEDLKKVQEEAALRRRQREAEDAKLAADLLTLKQLQKDDDERNEKRSNDAKAEMERLKNEYEAHRLQNIEKEKVKEEIRLMTLADELTSRDICITQQLRLQHEQQQKALFDTSRAIEIERQREREILDAKIISDTIAMAANERQRIALQIEAATTRALNKAMAESEVLRLHKELLQVQANQHGVGASTPATVAHIISSTSQQNGIASAQMNGAQTTPNVAIPIDYEQSPYRSDDDRMMVFRFLSEDVALFSQLPSDSELKMTPRDIDALVYAAGSSVNAAIQLLAKVTLLCHTPILYCC